MEDDDNPENSSIDDKIDQSAGGGGAMLESLADGDDGEAPENGGGDGVDLTVRFSPSSRGTVHRAHPEFGHQLYLSFPRFQKKERNPRRSDAAPVDRLDVFLELLLGLEGDLAFVALE